MRPRRPHLLPAMALAAVCGLFAAACGSTGHASGPSGQLDGMVVASPTCAVERPDTSCAPRPVPNRAVTVETPSGSAVATATTDASGRFSVTLAPGFYVVHVAIVPGGIGMRQVTPGNVSIEAGRTTGVTIVLDTGIRLPVAATPGASG